MGREIQDLSAALEGVVAGLAPSLVSVLSYRMQATGFVWRAELIVTSDEGLAEEGEVGVVLPGGESIVAHPVGRDPSTAIALLKIERPGLQPVAMAATLPATGALVLALGAEAGAPTAALGLVSVSRGPWQSMRGGEIDARIELDARLRSTVEGGLVVNAAGQPFGMTVFGPRRRALVIPSVTIGRIAARLETHGRVPRGYLGLGLQPVVIQGGGSGVMAMSVDPSGPGAAAAIQLPGHRRTGRGARGDVEGAVGEDAGVVDVDAVDLQSGRPGADLVDLELDVGLGDDRALRDAEPGEAQPDRLVGLRRAVVDELEVGAREIDRIWTIAPRRRQRSTRS